MDNMMLYWPATGCLLAVIVLLWAEFTGNRKAQWLFKPLAAALFVVQALVLGAWESAYGLAILAGLVLCFAGDVLLIPREREALFKAGIAAFLLGHVAYVVAFSLTGFVMPMAVLKLSVIALVGAGFYRWLQRHLPRDMRMPVIFYTIVIMGMVVTGIAAWVQGGPWHIAVAAVMFAVSDMAVARDRFVKREPVNALVISPLYFGAQILFALSIAAVAS